MGFMLAMVGLGLMIGMSGTGSAVGLVISGQAVMGLLKKKPEAFGMALGMASPPATQGLYGFVGFILYSNLIGTHPDLALWQGGIVLGAGLAVGIACLVSAIYQGIVCASGLAAAASGHNVFAQTFVLAAFPEFYAILSLIVAILMMGLLKF